MRMDDFLSSAPSGDALAAQPKRGMLAYALFYAKMGMRVLPLHTVTQGGCSCGNSDCHSVAKHPLTRNGVKEATCDTTQIHEWWRQHPQANIGVATGLGLLVIDIDPRHGGSLEALRDVMPSFPDELLHTGGGGLHIYLSHDPALTIMNSAGKLAAGIDVRGENGYVVAAPSLHASGQRYRWDHQPSLTPAPEALLTSLLQKRLASPTPPASNDTPISSTSTSTPPASPSSQFITEGTRNSTLVSLAGSLRKQGANEEALFVVLQALNKGCCQPPLSEAEVRQICKSAANWTPGTSGNATSATSGGTMAVKQVSSLMTEDFPPTPWAIPTLLPEGVSLLAGKPKMGKSWLALSMALSIACGGPALGRLPTNQGAVLYLGLEDNEQRICSRVSKMLLGATPPDTLFWSGSCAPLTMGGLAALEGWIKSAVQPRLIVIDTLARVRAQNGSSNSSMYADDYAAITPLKQMAEKYHVSFLLVHHLRKMRADDPMDEISGSTGLTGATDCNMVLSRKRGQDQARLLVTGRDVEDQSPVLSFDATTGLWSISDIPADELSAKEKPSEVRQAILTLLAQKDLPLSPTEIATELSLDYDVVRKRLSLMKKDEQLFSSKRGLYQIARPAQENDASA